MAETKTSKKGIRKTRILDVAEELFARHGYDGVTMRMIATRAEVDVALASYHFGSKMELFEAALFRRADPMNAVRNKALDDLEDACGDEGPTIEQLIEVTLAPLFGPEVEFDDGLRHYYELTAYINNSTVLGDEWMGKLFGDLLTRYLKAYQRALPDADPADIYWCYHFMSGAIALTMAQTGRIDKYSGGLCSAKDMVSAYQRMVPFITAGFKNICKN